VRKTDATVENINARVKMTANRSRVMRLNDLMTLQRMGHEIEQGTLEAFARAEYGRGWNDGVDDANGDGF
jgi:hypothetical protein